ncbi:hypothetical protein OCC_10880 [Thermococcus litoralis DSM 5473]|uniref:Uncharacterized protein n=1 Tax=Thermococcus litoralis (strain ATCC 51850 / DSM 5473 / JCM 8560 / NS-C) TaxID=523849 RepID=H3ZR26_THELN|nr:hypothetical protein OCC_10880 [Thermococcus litoralis DSM 5473]
MNIDVLQNKNSDGLRCALNSTKMFTKKLIVKQRLNPPEFHFLWKRRKTPTFLLLKLV